jgi:hypothetical protein
MQRLRFLSLLTVLSLPVWSQDRATLNGTVTDASGSIVAGAAVELKSAETGFHREGSTNSAGIYEFTPLAVGSYTVTVLKAGFKPAAVKNVDILFGQTRTLDVRLEVGATTETVEVAAHVESLNQSNAEIGGVIESTQIK